METEEYEPVDRSPRWSIYVAAFILALMVENVAVGVFQYAAVPFAPEPGDPIGVAATILLSLLDGLVMAAVWIGFYSLLNQLDLKKVLPWVIGLAAFRILVSGTALRDEEPIIWIEMLVSHGTWIVGFAGYFWLTGRLRTASQPGISPS
ncbi:hypothetical protein E5163_06825 [Marinicauda algicola]|uniref:Uncharacterized protein n=1 Tax=Marinicauda algicola TaxID=2029849 RepID=A0A4S2H044_9PROT|nr:hypothetical protein [Marinicauda algicola]TGY88846.1 hypothetical protein E5163_06825 [Marinicauda algicola]